MRQQQALLDEFVGDRAQRGGEIAARAVALEQRPRRAAWREGDRRARRAGAGGLLFRGVPAGEARDRQRLIRQAQPDVSLPSTSILGTSRSPCGGAGSPGIFGQTRLFAGASLALLDAVLHENPPFAGALRQRLALRAATACAALTRHREDSSALRDAEHLSPNAGGNAPTSPAGRIHRLWRGFAAPSVGFDEPSLRKAADLLELPRDLDLEALAGALRRLFQGEKNPLAAAARAGSTTTRMLDGAPGVYSIGWSSSASCANCRGGPVFGSTAYRDRQ